MNVKNKLIFDQIRERVESAENKIVSILTDYKSAVVSAEKAAEKYNDSYKKSFLSERKAEATAQARERLTSVGAEFKKKTMEDVGKLREELTASVMEAPSAQVKEFLANAREYGIAPSRMQLEELTKLNNGNRQGLAIINRTLEATQSPLRLVFAEDAAYEEDLSQLTRLANNMSNYVPQQTNVFHYGVEVWKGEPLTRYRADGSSYVSGGWDSVGLILNSSGVSIVKKDLDSMAERWSGNISTRIADAASAEALEADRQAIDAGEEPPAVPQIEPSATISDGEGEALARKIGRQKANDTAVLRSWLNQHAK